METPKSGPLKSAAGRASLLLAAGAAVSAAVGASAQSLWWGDLLSHFRLQYIAVLFVAGTVLALLGRKAAAVFALGVAVCLAATLAPYWSPLEPQAQAGVAERWSLLSWNVNSKLVQWDVASAVIRQADADLVLIQELNHEGVRAADAMADLYPHRLLEPRSDNFGMGILSKTPLRSPWTHPVGGYAVPLMEVKVEALGRMIQVWNLHPVPPAGEHNSQQRDAYLEEVVRRASKEGALVVAGDFNAAPWSKGYRHIVDGLRLADSAYGRGLSPTWFGMGALWQLPIDHALFRGGLRVVERKVGERLDSDHRPILVVFTGAT